MAPMVILFSYQRSECGCDLQEISRHEERMGLVEVIKLINYQGSSCVVTLFLGSNLTSEKNLELIPMRIRQVLIML